MFQKEENELFRTRFSWVFFIGMIFFYIFFIFLHTKGFRIIDLKIDEGIILFFIVATFIWVNIHILKTIILTNEKIIVKYPFNVYRKEIEISSIIIIELYEIDDNEYPAKWELKIKYKIKHLVRSFSTDDYNIGIFFDTFVAHLQEKSQLPITKIPLKKS